MPTVDYPNPFLATEPLVKKKSSIFGSPEWAIEKAKLPVTFEDRKLVTVKPSIALKMTVIDYPNPFLATEPLSKKETSGRHPTAAAIEKTSSAPLEQMELAAADRLKTLNTHTKVSSFVLTKDSRQDNEVCRNDMTLNKTSPELESPIAPKKEPTKGCGNTPKVSSVVGTKDFHQASPVHRAGMTENPKEFNKKILQMKAPVASKQESRKELTYTEVCWILQNNYRHLEHLRGPMGEDAEVDGVSGLLRKIKGNPYPILFPRVIEKLISMTDEVIFSCEGYRAEVIGIQDKLDQLLPNKNQKSHAGKVNLVEPVVVLQVPAPSAPPSQFINRLLWGTFKFGLSLVTFYKEPFRA